MASNPHPRLLRTPAPAFRRWRQRLRAATLDVPIEPILHASPLRLKLLGIYTLIGHPLFYLLWSEVWPQPFEDGLVRLAMTLLGLPLMLDAVARQPRRALAGRVFNAITFVQLPLFFSWMYVMNRQNDVWLASLATVIVIYFHLTDWRIAAIGSLVGLILGGLLAQPWITPATWIPGMAHLAVITFAWMSGLLLGISGANLRRERIEHALTTIGIMAHELRTPLATAALIADAMRMEAQRPDGPPRAPQLDKWATRLQQLARTMNHHIDLQIANARLLQLSNHGDRIHAAALVREAVAAFPYRSERERNCVRIDVHQDFAFSGSHSQWLRVLDNLLHNSLRALYAAGTPLSGGAIVIEVGVRGRQGRIRVTDQGTGIDPQIAAHVFEPFYSTDLGVGHGLGLAFCRRIVESAGGTIAVHSRPGEGAVFSITLPVLES